MPGFTTVPFATLLRRMRREAESSRAIFDLPVRKWFRPGAEMDFSATHFSSRASTPVGPAAGPHTQLAQNIVLAWLAGSRILELKTVQVLDNLEIPRPCIHVPNVGYNVEWSQELTVAESIREYAKAVYLIEILKRTRAFGVLTDAPGFPASLDTIYDTSIGYDLAGIRSERVTGYLRMLRDPAPLYEELRRELTGDLAVFRDVELPAAISNCVTLSTFHGCPAGEIESIVRYLLEECGFHAIIKFNPTLLGFEKVRELLHDRLGYRHLALDRAAFDKDLQYDDALEMLRRLRRVAESHGLGVGGKFTNTLVVANKPEFFPTHTEPYMYLSGQPLHVISMNLMQRVREDAGFEFPVSFSAGIDKKNFPAAVACGMVPVTTCTDLLREGGYARLPHYLDALAAEMRRARVSSREAFVLAAHGHGAEAAEESLRAAPGGAQIWDREGPFLREVTKERPDELPHALRQAAAAAGLDGNAVVLRATQIAGRRNGRDIVPMLVTEPRYHASATQAEPRRIASTLALYDCINCDLCIPACPNDAMFSYEATPVETPTERLRLGAANRLERTAGSGFTIRKAHQLAVVAGFCNQCSNCEVYCPETGAPFKLKERVFVNLADFEAPPRADGFCRQGNGLLARLGGVEMRLEPHLERNRAAVHGPGFRLELQWEPFAVLNGERTGSPNVDFDTALLWRMKTVWESIFLSAKPNIVHPDPVAAPLEAHALPQSSGQAGGPASR